MIAGMLNIFETINNAKDTMNMQKILAFDIYGTLIDTHGIVSQLESLIGDIAREFSASWRNKQLEYSFRRGLMGYYQDFSICTRDALLYCCEQYRLNLSEEGIRELLDLYKMLPAFADVKPALSALNEKQIACHAFSNGSRSAVQQLLECAGLERLIASVVSVDDVQTFKPDPRVYQHFLKKTGACREGTWLVSSNPFDIIGAIHAGWQTAWVYRSQSNIFDPWGMEPTVAVPDLRELAMTIMGNNGRKPT